MIRKIPLVNGHYYHIFNRGVDKRTIFLDPNDRYRFIHDLFEFNDLDAVINVNRRTDGGETSISKKPRKLLVEIIVFCLMPNHFHLILKQKKDNGITKFMRKLGTGYTMYFNKVCQRSGALFEGAFKSRYIDNDEYLIHLSRYIHLNPVELIQPDWKKQGIKDKKAAAVFLEDYKWSSYLDYIGKHNYPSVINKEFLLAYLGSSEKYKKFVLSWLSEDIETIKDLCID